MVCMPMFGDQIFNAKRVEELGLGVRIPSLFDSEPERDLNHLSAAAISGAAEKAFAESSAFKGSCAVMRDVILLQNQYLHSKAVSDIATWVVQEKK